MNVGQKYFCNVLPAFVMLVLHRTEPLLCTNRCLRPSVFVDICTPVAGLHYPRFPIVCYSALYCVKCTQRLRMLSFESIAINYEKETIGMGLEYLTCLGFKSLIITTRLASFICFHEVPDHVWCLDLNLNFPMIICTTEPPLVDTSARRTSMYSRLQSRLKIPFYLSDLNVYS
jgi:hypothetical protein